MHWIVSTITTTTIITATLKKEMAWVLTNSVKRMHSLWVVLLTQLAGHLPQT